MFDVDAAIFFQTKHAMEIDIDKSWKSQVGSYTEEILPTSQL